MRNEMREFASNAEVRRHEVATAIKHPAFIFVYGTLLSEEPNNGLLAGSTLIGLAQTEPKFRMYSNGWFPYVQRSKVQIEERFADGSPSEELFYGYSIRGEVWQVSPKTLARLDMLEGVPHHYRRETISVNLSTAAEVAGDNWRAVDIYLYYGNTSGLEEIESGSWKDRYQQS